ncbi:hypothetical protein BDN72DRAFT_127511 [Pluteus cervinus]|uniref:Uncharacterized protein n=1 Tax=Pluteus cervinus TaxID=181527 RepID=A0ACD3AMB5_9AGAR|nr:hypothetical protein BDN72DRAFT_127511 [Pluteus cervinus]
MAPHWFSRLKKKSSSLPVAPGSANPPPPPPPPSAAPVPAQPPPLPSRYSAVYDGPPPPTPRNFRSFSHDQQRSKDSDFTPRLPSVKSATFHGNPSTASTMGNTTKPKSSHLHAPSLPTLREAQPTNSAPAGAEDNVSGQSSMARPSLSIIRPSQGSATPYTPLYPPLPPPSPVDLGRSAFSTSTAVPSSSKNPFLALSTPSSLTGELFEAPRRKDNDKEQSRLKSPEGKKLKDIMNGKEVVVSHPGSSQYMSQGNGSSACGLAALNCVRLVFAKAKEGLTGEDLIMYSMLQQTTDEVLSICRYWSNNTHLDVEDISTLAVFRRSIHLNRTHYGIPTGDWFEHVLTYLQESPETAVAVITRPPEIIACFKIPTSKSDVYLIFDSHPRPLHPRGAGFVFNTSAAETAKRLASILAFDSTLVEDPSMQWQAQLLGNCSSHIFTPSSVATSSEDVTQDLLELSMTSLLTKGQATEIRELKRDKERLEVALRGQQERRATLGQQVDDLTLANNGLRTQYGDANSMVTSLRKENERLLSDRRKREEQHTEIVTAHLKAIDSLNETIHQLRQQLEVTDQYTRAANRDKSKSVDSLPGHGSSSALSRTARLLNISTTAVGPSSADPAEEEDFPSTSSRPIPSTSSSSRAHPHPAQVSATSLLSPRTSSRTASGSKDKDGPNFILTSIALSPSKTRSASEPHTHLSLHVNQQHTSSPSASNSASVSPNGGNIGGHGHVKSASTPVRSTITLPPPLQRPRASSPPPPPTSAPIAQVPVPVLSPLIPSFHPSLPPPALAAVDPSSYQAISPPPILPATPPPTEKHRGDTKPPLPSSSPPPPLPPLPPSSSASSHRAAVPVPLPRPQAGPVKPRPHTYFDPSSSSLTGQSTIGSHPLLSPLLPNIPLKSSPPLSITTTAGSGIVDKADKALPPPPPSSAAMPTTTVMTTTTTTTTTTSSNAVLTRRRTVSRTSPINETNRFSVVIKEPLVSPKDREHRSHSHVLHKDGGVRGVKSARELRSPVMPGSWSEPETTLTVYLSKERERSGGRSKERDGMRDRDKDKDRERDRDRDREKERDRKEKDRKREKGKEREVVTDSEAIASGSVSKLLRKERSLRRVEGDRRLEVTETSSKGKEREKESSSSGATRARTTTATTPPEKAEKHRLSRILEDPTPSSTVSKGGKERGKDKDKDKDKERDKDKDKETSKAHRGSPESLSDFAQGLFNALTSGKANSSPPVVVAAPVIIPPTKVSSHSHRHHHQSASATGPGAPTSKSSSHGHNSTQATVAPSSFPSTSTFSKLHTSSSSSTIHGSYQSSVGIQQQPFASKEEDAMLRQRREHVLNSLQQQTTTAAERIRRQLVAEEKQWRAEQQQQQKLSQSQSQAQSQSQSAHQSQGQVQSQTQTQSQIQSQSQNSQKPKPKPKTFECRICFDEHVLDDIARVDGCDHVYCRECLRGYIVEGIKARKYPIRCPVCATVKDTKLPGVIGDLLIQLIGVPENLYAVYIEMQMSPFSILVTCRRCKRSAYIDRSEHDAAKLILCPLPDCSYTWCRMCNQEVRPQAMQTHSCDGTTELKALAKQQGWKNCPGCQAIVQKTEGCNHMACTAPGCNAHFCYLCGAMLHRGQRQADIEAAVSRHFRGSCQLFFVPAEPGGRHA